LLDDKKIKEVSKKYNKTASQICYRWSVQNNVVTIPQTGNLNRIIENSKIFDFEINKDDMNELNGLDKK
jgi:methylglyoxal/glyoxal reductase